jgi:hypothetical protein
MIDDAGCVTAFSRDTNPFGPCPACMAESFAAERHTDDVIFRCNACGAGWRFQFGYVSRVDPPDRDRIARVT